MFLRFDPTDGATYEDTYSGWLKFFKTVAESEESVVCVDVPTSWAPLLWYLGANVESTITFFSCDTLVRHDDYEAAKMNSLGREYVESVCTYRPELVDAMWKSDCEWDTVRRDHVAKASFIVTNNGSFHRPEVLDYVDFLRTTVVGVSRGVVLVPCAADKPYPAPLHKLIRQNIPDDYRLVIVTGVLGVVPEDLWPSMPIYDSGLPNRWRVMTEIKRYFQHAPCGRIVVYSDFYSEAISLGLALAGKDADYPLEEAGVWRRGQSGYLNLSDPKNLLLLRGAAK